MDNKIKHLEMIERIIERMAKNSFMLKGWAVTLIVGIIAVVARMELQFWIISVVPLLMFWALDSYYLSIERKYRELYNSVRLKKDFDIDYAISVKLTASDYFKAMISLTEALFYCVLFVAVIAVFIICKMV